jgi:hypothetical protein
MFKQHSCLQGKRSVKGGWLVALAAAFFVAAGVDCRRTADLVLGAM